jgi:hypothetical protein
MPDQRDAVATDSACEAASKIAACVLRFDLKKYIFGICVGTFARGSAVWEKYWFGFSLRAPLVPLARISSPGLVRLRRSEFRFRVLILRSIGIWYSA